MTQFETVLRQGVTIEAGCQMVTTSRETGSVSLSPVGRWKGRAHSVMVLAIQPQHALAVLGDHASEEERTILSGFHTTRW